MIEWSLTILFGVASWVFIIVDWKRMRCVPGTHERYVYATIQWAMVPFVAVSPLWRAFIGDPTWWWMLVTIANYYLIWCLYRDDDDNWWRRKKKQLKSWVRNLSQKPVAVTQGAS